MQGLCSSSLQLVSRISEKGLSRPGTSEATGRPCNKQTTWLFWDRHQFPPSIQNTMPPASGRRSRATAGKRSGLRPASKQHLTSPFQLSFSAAFDCRREPVATTDTITGRAALGEEMWQAAKRSSVACPSHPSPPPSRHPSEKLILVPAIWSEGEGVRAWFPSPPPPPPSSSCKQRV